MLASRGVVQGTSGHAFSPASNVTRADFIVLLTQALELQAVDEELFANVLRGEHYAEAAGIAYGVEDGRFDPSASVARQDMLVMIASSGILKGEVARRGMFLSSDKNKFKKSI